MNRILILISSVGILLLSAALLTMIKSNSYIGFSDSAKYADIARNVVQGNGYERNFVFFSGIKNNYDLESTWLADWPPPVTPVFIALSFKIFGISDAAVKYATVLSFIVTLILIYLFTYKLYDGLTAILTVIATGFSYTILNYSVSGGTEMIFIFEIVFGLYLLSLNKKLANVSVIFLSILLYLTRPQFFIFSLGFLLFYLLNKYSFKKSFFVFVLLTIVWIIADTLLLSKVNGKGYLYSVFSFGSYGLSNVSASDQLRGVVGELNLQQIFNRLFYNLYNFYKALPEIMNPYLFALFVVGIFRKYSSFKLSVIFMTGATFLVTALTIPFYRYLHPVIPLIYIVGVATLCEIINYQITITKQIQILNFKITKQGLAAIIITFLVLFFAVGQTLGIIFLDSRFERKTHNVGKAPIYFEMSYKLKEITEEQDVILTNLDTWGSWYGERKTIWFPLTPNHLSESDLNIDYIYLTSYKMDDENYYMGEKWREIFNNPKNQKVLPDYKYVGEYEFKATDNYERENGRAILLERND